MFSIFVFIKSWPEKDKTKKETEKEAKSDLPLYPAFQKNDVLCVIDKFITECNCFHGRFVESL